MFKKLKDKSQGFTIIEVLIVLAIAGLIMVIVFLAVPALQRSQRNNARREDASNFLAAASEYAANNNGNLATGGSDLTALQTPAFYEASAITVRTSCTSSSCTAVPNPTDSQLTIVNNAKCPSPVPANTTVAVTYSARSVAAVFAVEGASGDINQCLQS